jgi:hypothetical protein
MKKQGSIEVWHSIKSKITFVPDLLEDDPSTTLRAGFRGGRHYVFEGYISKSTYNKLARERKLNKLEINN